MTRITEYAELTFVDEDGNAVSSEEWMEWEIATPISDVLSQCVELKVGKGE